MMNTKGATGSRPARHTLSKKLSTSGGINRKFSKIKRREFGSLLSGNQYKRPKGASKSFAAFRGYEDYDGAEMNVDFLKLSSKSLQRYCEFYDLKYDHECSKHELADSVGQHFVAQQVDEHTIISQFLNVNTSNTAAPPGRERSGSGGSSGTSWEQKPSQSKGSHSSHSQSAPNTPSRRDSSASRKKATTYGDMIAHALRSLPREQGTLEDICTVIEKQFWTQLNHELESGPRKIPVWKASVRKIINLNYGMRFQRTGTDSHGKACFGFAK